MEADFSHRIVEAVDSDLRLSVERLRERSLAEQAGILDGFAMEQILSSWLAEGELSIRSSRSLTEALGVEFWSEQFL